MSIVCLICSLHSSSTWRGVVMFPAVLPICPVTIDKLCRSSPEIIIQKAPSMVWCGEPWDYLCYLRIRVYSFAGKGKVTLNYKLKNNVIGSVIWPAGLEFVYPFLFNTRHKNFHLAPSVLFYSIIWTDRNCYFKMAALGNDMKPSDFSSFTTLRRNFVLLFENEIIYSIRHKMSAVSWKQYAKHLSFGMFVVPIIYYSTNAHLTVTPFIRSLASLISFYGYET